MYFKEGVYIVKWKNYEMDVVYKINKRIKSMFRMDWKAKKKTSIDRPGNKKERKKEKEIHRHNHRL